MDIHTTAGAVQAVLACRLQQYRHHVHERIVRIRTRDTVTLPASISEHVALVLRPPPVHLTIFAYVLMPPRVGAGPYGLPVAS